MQYVLFIDFLRFALMCSKYSNSLIKADIFIVHLYVHNEM